MFRKTSAIILFIFLTGAFFAPAYPAQVPLTNYRYLGYFSSKDRILILAPHPDDEGIGCAGVIQEALQRGAQVKVAYLTSGDYNQLSLILYKKRPPLLRGEYVSLGKTRMQESIKAMGILGVEEKNLIFLGYPDFGTFTIFSQYWQGRRVYESILTRISSVPYKNALSPGAPYQGESILADLEKVILDYQPTKIFVSHPADVNGDHKTFYLFLEIALADLGGRIVRPQVYPYLVHWPAWPLPRHYHPELDLVPPGEFVNSSLEWRKFILSRRELDNKHKMILSYPSQTSSTAFYLLAFARRNELFGGYEDIEIRKRLSAEEKAGRLSRLFDMTGYLGISNYANTYNIVNSQGRVSYEAVDNYLVIRIKKDKGMKDRFGAMCYLFGYSYHKPFKDMPKINIIVMGDKIRVFDKKKRLHADAVSVTLSSEEIALKVALGVLGDPDFILASVKVYGGASVVDAAAFRKIFIRE